MTAQTPAERARKFREKITRAGHKQILVSLSPKGVQALNQLNLTGLTQSEAVEMALVKVTTTI